MSNKSKYQLIICVFLSMLLIYSINAMGAPIATKKKPAQIKSIATITYSITEGDSFQFPTFVKALMDNRKTQNVFVSWTPATVDPNVIGISKFVGKVKGYPKSVGLILTIKKKPVFISKIEDLEVTQKQWDSYSLPTELEALMSDGSKRNVNVDWEAYTSVTTTLGVTSYHGTIDGYEAGVTLKMNVLPVVLSVEELKVTVNHKAEYNVPAMVNVTMSDGTIKSLKVDWGSDKIDTTTVGRKTISGTITGYDKGVTLIVTVEPYITKVDNIEVRVKQFDEYILPSKLQAHMSDGTVQEKPVDWSKKQLDTSRCALGLFTGWMSGYENSISLRYEIYSYITNTEVVTAKAYTNDYCELPEWLKIYWSNGSTGSEKVSWSQNPINTSKFGEYSITGTIGSYGLTTVAAVSITEKPELLKTTKYITNVNHEQDKFAIMITSGTSIRLSGKTRKKSVLYNLSGNTAKSSNKQSVSPQVDGSFSVDITNIVVNDEYVLVIMTDDGANSTQHSYCRINLVKDTENIYIKLSDIYSRNYNIFNTVKADNPIYLSSSSSVQSDNPTIIKKAQEIVAGLTDDYTKIKAIHDWVANTITYDANGFLTGNYVNKNEDAVSVYNSRTGVCTGYANLTAALLRAIGIHTRVVSGFAQVYGFAQGNEKKYSWAGAKNSSNHAWNEAYANGRWIILDTTLDSTLDTKYLLDSPILRGVRYQYFDPTLEYFSEDHLIIRYDN